GPAVGGEPDDPGLVTHHPAGARVEEEQALTLGYVRGDVRPCLAAIGRLEHHVAAGDVADAAEHLDVVEVFGRAAGERGPRLAAIRGAAELALAVGDPRLGGTHGGDALGALGRAGRAVGP